MKPRSISVLDRALAQICRVCPVCIRARKKPAGMAYRWVTRVEERICPFCRAYKRVYGRRAHEPMPVQSDR